MNNQINNSECRECNNCKYLNQSFTVEPCRECKLSKNEGSMDFDISPLLWEPIEENAQVEEEAPDNVNHPSHYETGKFECIDVMIETQGIEAVKAFCICNAFKYIYRHKNKNGVEDVKKAIWYLNKFVELESTSSSE